MNATSIPPGIPRTKATLDVVSAARKAGYDGILAQAELELIGCYLQVRNPGKALEYFSSTLTRLLYRPELYDTRSITQLGRFFPAVIEGASKHPDVPLSLINHLLVGLEAFQESLSPSPAASDYLRHRIRLAMGYPVTERTCLDRAINRVTSADSHSLQRAIDITQIEMAIEKHPDAALQVAWRMLTNEIPGAQKSRLLRVMLPALVAQHAWQVAWEAHLISYEFDREEGRLANLAEHFSFLAVIGMWRRLVRVLERHISLIRHAHDPWDLFCGLRGIVGSLEALALNGYANRRLKVSLAPASRFHELPALVRPSVIEAQNLLGRALSGLARRFDDRNGTVEVSASLGLFDYEPVPEGLVLSGNEGDARFMARLLRVRALLECNQGFDALLLLGGLEQTRFPSVLRLGPEIRMLTSLARMQMSHDATSRLESQQNSSEVGGQAVNGEGV